MEHAGSDPSPLDQLERAVHTVPPDITAARIAIVSIAEELQGMQRDERVSVTQSAADLCGELAEAEEVSEDIAAEFGAHRGTYRTIATILGEPTDQVSAPTNTAAKSMSGSKKKR